jgi:hypothetical protein
LNYGGVAFMRKAFEKSTDFSQFKKSEKETLVDSVRFVGYKVRGCQVKLE